MQANLRVSSFLQFLGELQDAMVLQEMAEVLDASEEDHINFAMEVVENGQFFRFEAQDGILALIQTAMESFGPGGAPQEF